MKLSHWMMFSCGLNVTCALTNPFKNYAWMISILCAGFCFWQARVQAKGEKHDEKYSEENGWYTIREE